MQDTNTENLDSQNEEITEEVAETTEETTEEVDVEALKEQNKKLFERAKRAEGFIQDKDGNWVKKSKPEVKEAPVNESKLTEVSLTPKDYLALTENGVKAEEYERVLELSTLLKKPVFETLKDSTAQQILKSEGEERATAKATATSVTARKSGKSGKEIVLDNFDKGKLPETEEDGKNLAEAQFEQLLNKGTK